MIGTLRALALIAAGLMFLAGCGEAPEGEQAPIIWQNPDEGSISAPVELTAAELPYTGRVTGGIGYYRVTGLQRDFGRIVSIAGLTADADLFVLGNAAFTAYECSSTRGGAAEDACETVPLPEAELFIEVYGFHNSETYFTLDVEYY